MTGRRPKEVGLSSSARWLDISWPWPFTVNNLHAKAMLEIFQSIVQSIYDTADSILDQVFAEVDQQTEFATLS